MTRSPRHGGRDETPEVTDIAQVAESLLAEARRQPSRRAARTLVASTGMRATLIALLEGAELSEHSSPPTAILQTLTGTVSLRTRDARQALRAGQIVRVPPQRHSLHAEADAVVLLTVALR